MNPHFLEKFMNPHTFAFYGANENIPYNMGAFQLLTLIDNGFKGKIYPIHPKLETIFGIKAYKSINDVPGKVDLAEIVVSKKHIPNILKELGENPDREGLKKTPERMSQALKEITTGYNTDIDKLLNNAFFNVDYKEMVIV